MYGNIIFTICSCWRKKACTIVSIYRIILCTFHFFADPKAGNAISMSCKRKIVCWLVNYGPFKKHFFNTYSIWNAFSVSWRKFGTKYQGSLYGESCSNLERSMQSCHVTAQVGIFRWPKSKGAFTFNEIIRWVRLEGCLTSTVLVQTSN